MEEEKVQVFSRSRWENWFDYKVKLQNAIGKYSGNKRKAFWENIREDRTEEQLRKNLSKQKSLSNLPEVEKLQSGCYKWLFRLANPVDWCQNKNVMNDYAYLPNCGFIEFLEVGSECRQLSGLLRLSSSYLCFYPFLTLADWTIREFIQGLTAQGRINQHRSLELLTSPSLTVEHS